MLMKFLKSKKGFTLVELMVVVVILGILTAIAVPVYKNVQTNAEVQAVAASVRTLNSAVSLYVTQQLSANPPEIVHPDIATDSDAEAAAQALVAAGLLQEVPGNIDDIYFAGSATNPIFSATAPVVVTEGAG